MSPSQHPRRGAGASTPADVGGLGLALGLREMGSRAESPSSELGQLWKVPNLVPVGGRPGGLCEPTLNGPACPVWESESRNPLPVPTSALKPLGSSGCNGRQLPTVAPCAGREGTVWSLGLVPALEDPLPQCGSSDSIPASQLLSLSLSLFLTWGY